MIRFVACGRVTRLSITPSRARPQVLGKMPTDAGRRLECIIGHRSRSLPSGSRCDGMLDIREPVAGLTCSCPRNLL